MNEDFLDILKALIDAGVRFIVVGAHALAVHGVPRATGDLDVWIDRDATNADRVWGALVKFGAPVEAMGVSRRDLQAPGMVVQIGLPPRRIDLVTSITGVEFEEAWTRRVSHRIEGCDLPFISRSDLVQNKRATGRLKDLADLEALGEKP